MKKQKPANFSQSHFKTFLSSILMRGWLFSFLLIPTLTYAQSKGGSFFGASSGKKSQAREGSRWTLQEWLAQKQRNNLMDQWLMMNSSSPFEFYLLGASNSYESQKNLEAKKSYTSYSGGLAAYAQAVGLTGEYENNLKEHYNDVSGMLSIRILGSSIQSTSITLHAGQRTRQYMEGTEKESVRNLLGQISLQAYFTKYFGITGSYRQYFPADHDTLGDVSGTLTEGGIFIDFNALRIFGTWSDDLQVNKASTGVKTEYKRKGIKSGIVIFF